MSNDKNDAIFSVTSDGVNSKIKINTPPGASVTTNATKTNMQNVEQESSGGKISRNATDLTQVGGSQTARNKGKMAKLEQTTMICYYEIWKFNLIPKNLTGLPKSLKQIYGQFYKILYPLDRILSKLPVVNLLSGVIECVARKKSSLR